MYRKDLAVYYFRSLFFFIENKSQTQFILRTFLYSVKHLETGENFLTKYVRVDRKRCMGTLFVNILQITKLISKIVLRQGISLLTQRYKTVSSLTKNFKDTNFSYYKLKQ